MKTSLDHPQLLLLACALEHVPAETRASLETLGEQEEEHMGMVVQEMVKLGVKLVLAGYHLTKVHVSNSFWLM